MDTMIKKLPVIIGYVIGLLILAVAGFVALRPFMIFFSTSFLFAALSFTLIFVSIMFLDTNRKKFNKNFPFNISFTTIALIYTFVVFLVIFIVEFRFMPPIPNFDATTFEFKIGSIDIGAYITGVYFTVHAILLLVVMLVMVFMYRSYAHFKEITEVTDRNVQNIRLLCADIKAMLEESNDIEGETRAPVKKRLEGLLEAVTYSDPMTDPAVAEIESAIRSGIYDLGNMVADLKTSPDTALFDRKVTELERAIKNRNEKIKILK